MADLDILDSDLVVVRLSLRSRDDGAPLTLNETITVSELGFSAEGGGGKEVPQLDNALYAQLMSSDVAADRERGFQMLADFHEQTAEFVADGGAPPAESLATAIVSWVLETQPKGHQFTSDPNGEGYVISPDEINIHGPIQMDEDRLWRVTAVGTWG